MKRLRIGRRRARAERSSSPLELALAPALVDGRWQVPEHFNFTRDVVEALASDPKRRALTSSGKDGIIEPRTFGHVAESVARWASVLRERGVTPGDRVLVLVGNSSDWMEVVLGCLKVGAVVVPTSPNATAAAIEVRVAATGASLIVADHTPGRELAQMSFAPDVHHVDDEHAQLAAAAPAEAPTHHTSSRDTAFILSSSGTGSGPRAVAHTHGATFAARVPAEHWLDATRGDAVWCTADVGSAQRVWSGLIGPWSRGAEIVLHDGEFDAQERLDLIHRLSVTILCQTPAEYRALSELRRRDLERYQPRRLRRLVSTGDYLEPDVVAVFEEVWGMTIHDGYGQAETNIVVANGADAGFKPGALGLPLPGHQVAVVDGQGNELPPGIEGDLAVRGKPPTLFTGYWDSPDETKQAFSGDWYVTGDVAARDEDGFLWFVGRASDVIASRGRTFGPHEVERALRGHEAVRAAAVVGIRDLERGGHFVRAFVVLQPRARISQQLEAELRQHVADVLPEQHVPREVEFVAELPVTPSGKVRRDELRERAVVGRPLWDAPPAQAEAAPAASVAPATPPVALPAPHEPMPQALPPEPALPEPEPSLAAETALDAPEPIVEVQPAPAAEVEPEPVARAEPEPVAVVDPEPVAVEPEPAPEPAPPPQPEPEPVLEQLVEPAPEPVREAPPLEPVPLPDYVVDPVPGERVAGVSPAPEPEPEDEDLGPLPDYVVDPDRPTPLAPVPEPEPPSPDPAFEAPAAAEPESPLAGLGLKPVTEFPRRESSSEGDGPGGRRRSSRYADPRSREPSEGDPGDEAEEVGWMQGLSSRLSAYSLGADAEPETDDEDLGEDAASAPDEAEGS